MDKNLIERYKTEMLNMYKRVKPVNASIPGVNTDVPERNEMSQTSGGLIAIVTTLRTLYPVKNAKVTVYTGEGDKTEVIDTDFTDESGRTKEFILPAPERALSMDSENTEIPYAKYNISVTAEGYRDNIHINIPVFSGVTSLQRSNMMLLETAGLNKGPQVFDESQKFDL